VPLVAVGAAFTPDALRFAHIAIRSLASSATGESETVVVLLVPVLPEGEAFTELTPEYSSSATVPLREVVHEQEYEVAPVCVIP